MNPNLPKLENIPPPPSLSPRRIREGQLPIPPPLREDGRPVPPRTTNPELTGEQRGYGDEQDGFKALLFLGGVVVIAGLCYCLAYVLKHLI